MNELIKKYIGSFIRGLIYTLAGTLIAIGAMKPEVRESFVAVNAEVIIGLITYFFAQGWSFFQKTK